MPSPPDVNVTCDENKVRFYWISGFDGGEKQIFYVIALSEIEKSENILSSIADEGFGTHNKLSVDIEPGRYTFYIFTNNSYGGVNSTTTVCSVLGNVDVKCFIILFTCEFPIRLNNRNNCVITEIRPGVILITDYFHVYHISMMLTLVSVNVNSFPYHIYSMVNYHCSYFSSVRQKSSDIFLIKPV